MDIREIFATNLRAARKAVGLSQEELAHRADVDRTYVSSLERCVYAAGIDVVDRLAKVLEVEQAGGAGARSKKSADRGSKVWGPQEARLEPYGLPR
jgi:transcriptional regulator with XRE-family HTH domain